MTKHVQAWTWIAKQVCLAGIAILMLAGLCLSQTATTSSPSDWTEFHRDNMARWNPYETVLNVNNVGSLQLKWSFTMSAKSGGSAPAVANGVVYASSWDDNVYALNASTGAKLWSFATGFWVCCGAPAVANGAVYAGSVDGNLYALNASTGAKLWSFAAVNTSGGGYSSPAVVNGIVYVASWETPDSGWPGHVYALDGSAGAMLWTFAVGESPTWPMPDLAVANGVVYASGSGDGNLYALDASTGAELWSYAAGGRVQSPAVANGVVYVGSADGNVYALNASTGAKLWSYATGGQVVETSPAVASAVVYVGTDRSVYALNANTGAKLWSYATSGYLSSPAVANGVVYVGNSDGTNGNVYALNANTGAKLWSYTAGGVVWSPVVVDGVVYFSSDVGGQGNGIVYAFGLPTGADLQLQVSALPSPVPTHSLYTYTFNITNNGPDPSAWPRLVAHVPYGATFHSYKFLPSGTGGTGYCVTPVVGTRGDVTCRYQGTQAVGTTWSVELTVWAWAPPGTVNTETAGAWAATHDPSRSNNVVTITTNVQ